MARFMLILHESPNPAYRQLSPDEIQKVIEKYRAWSGKLAAAGRMRGGDKLREEGGKVIMQRAGRVSVTDGPYTEAKEVVGGYYMIEARDYNDAAGLASDCPHLAYGRIEVREVEVMAGSSA